MTLTLRSFVSGTSGKADADAPASTGAAQFRCRGSLEGSFRLADYYLAGSRHGRRYFGISTSETFCLQASNPFARISVDAVYGQLMAGREIVPNLFLEGGFRRSSA